jgi:hypothetical protein
MERIRRSFLKWMKTLKRGKREILRNLRSRRRRTHGRRRKFHGGRIRRNITPKNGKKSGRMMRRTRINLLRARKILKRKRKRTRRILRNQRRASQRKQIVWTGFERS